MDITDIIVIAAIVLVIGSAVAYIVRAKLRGQKCIGCPDSATCSSGGAHGSCSGNCSCCSGECGKK